jgi:3-phosphoshikimate 1-carboxyvinyltransferase
MRPGRVRVSGVIRVPGDKSISHRALMLSALATGPSRVRGLLQSDDVKATAAVLRTLGWAIPPVADAMEIVGTGFRAPLDAPLSALDCANSGTTARLVAGIAAAQPFTSELTGDLSLSRRPMRRVAAPLEAMGARIEFPGGTDGLPMRIHGGPLQAIEWELPVASAQLKSAVLLAGLVSGAGARVREPAPSRDHTERMLVDRGAAVHLEGDWIHLAPVERLAPVDVDVPGDPSSAAFFVALGLLADDGHVTIANVLRNPHRDGFLRAVQRMGGTVFEERIAGAGRTAEEVLVVRPSPLRGITIAPAEVTPMLDEIPVLAVVAARAEGETVVRGAGELRVKESDRLATVVANLRAIGADAEELPDGLVVRGSQRPLRGRVVTHGDHRIAMAFAILGATRDCDVEIDDVGCVAVSYPSFWTDLRNVVG